MGLLDNFYRVAEPAATLATGAAAEPIAGWGGLLNGGDAQTVNKLRAAMTYQPRTAAGKDGMNKLARLLMDGNAALVDQNPPVKAVVEGYHDLADMAGHYNPLLGALFDTLPTAAGLLGGPGRGALSSAGRSLAPKAGEMVENYMAKTGGALHMLPPEVFKSLIDKQNSGQKLSVTERVMLQNHQSDMLGGLDDKIRTVPQPPASPGR